MVHTHDITISGDVVHKRYVAWDRGEPEREWAALELLARKAPGLAPAPIERTTQDGRPVVVMSLLPGRPLTGDLAPAQQGGLADALRRLFAVRVPEGLAERANGPDWMRTTTLEWLAEDYDLSACREPELVREAKDRAVAWLAALLLEPPVDLVIALGDGNLDNVLWDGEVCRLIDWEEYGVSDLAYELADLVEHASSRLTRILDVDRLLATFALTHDQAALVANHRRLLACFWLAMLLPGNGGFARNPAGSTEDQARHLLALLA